MTIIDLTPLIENTFISQVHLENKSNNWPQVFSNFLSGFMSDGRKDVTFFQNNVLQSLYLLLQMGWRTKGVHSDPLTSRRDHLLKLTQNLGLF